MKKQGLADLSRRERQIMDIIYQKEHATAAEVRKLLPDPLSDSSVRTLLRVLEKKGYLKHKEKDLRYVYFPTLSREKAKYSALKHLMQTFFDGSNERIVAALMDISGSDMTDEERDRLMHLIKQAKKEGK